MKIFHDMKIYHFAATILFRRFLKPYKYCKVLVVIVIVLLQTSLSPRDKGGAASHPVRLLELSDSCRLLLGAQIDSARRQ